MNARPSIVSQHVHIIFVLAISAAMPTRIIAQNLSPRPSEMRHRTKMDQRGTAQARVTAQKVDGRWDTLPFNMPINPVHVALMHTGNVLIISGSGNDPDNTNLQAAVWNPKTLTIKTFQISWDMFCGGMVILPDGKPFIFGGTLKYDKPVWLGETRCATFDPAVETFADTPGMGTGKGRWYPGGVVLGDGSVLVYSGADNLNGDLNTSVQIWSGTQWSDAGTAFQDLRFYPRQHVLPNGKVFISGASPNSQKYDPSTRTFSFVANTILNVNGVNLNRDYGTSVLLPLTPENEFKPKVMIMGGNNGGNEASTETTELIDLSVAEPKWVLGPNMNKQRIQMNATILPNGKVLISGGSIINEETPTAVKEAQLYDPVANAFSTAGMMEFPRVYHSNTLLLPDATVVALGGNPERKTYQQDIEIYSPAYLYKQDGQLAERPMITSVTSGVLHYGDEFNVTTPDASNIKSVLLIRPGAVTHSFDFEQRLVGLTFKVADGGLQPRAPVNGNLAPPGYYLLFLINKDGVPSVARFVQLMNRR